MSISNTVNYSGDSPTMQWATDDSDIFNRTHVANTAQVVEQHRHGLNDGLAVIRVNTTTALTNPGDVFINSTTFTYRDNQGTPVNQTLATLGIDNTFTGNNSFTSGTFTSTLKVPVSAGAAPTSAGAVAFDSTAKVLVYGNGTSTVSLAGAGPTGTLSAAAFGTTDPSGGFLADGRPVSRSTYAALFAKIGTAYGVGDGATTFNIFDGRSRIPMGADNMGTAAGAASRTSTNNALGNTSGEDTHTLTTAESAVLSYPVTDSGHFHDGMTDPSSGLAYDNSRTIPGSLISSTLGDLQTINSGPAHPSRTGLTTTGVSVSSNAGGGAHNNRQLNQIANWIIWY